MHKGWCAPAAFTTILIQPQNVLEDLKAITKRIEAQRTLDLLWSELKIPVQPSPQVPKKRKAGSSDVLFSAIPRADLSSSLTDSSVRNIHCKFGMFQSEVPMSPFVTPPPSDDSDLSSN